MKKIETLREVQLAELFVFNETMKVCDKIGVSAYPVAGTLLGAVRHKGFIPWDDDIDLCISRPDYEILLKKTEGKIGEFCSLIDPETDKQFKGVVPQVVYNNSKMISKQFKEDENLKLGVSLFIYDGTPSGKFSRYLYYKKMYVLRAKHALCRADFKHVNTKKAKVIGPLLQPFFKPSSVYKYKDKILKYQKKRTYEESNLVCTNADSGSSREVIPKERFERTTDVVFENIPCKAFDYCHEYLTNYYGDYLQLPPEEKRIQKHSFDIEIDDDFDFEWNNKNR